MVSLWFLGGFAVVPGWFRDVSWVVSRWFRSGFEWGFEWGFEIEQLKGLQLE